MKVLVKMLVARLCPTPCDLMDCISRGSSFHEILQARILEWIAIPFSRESSWPKDRTWVSCIAGWFCTIWATRWNSLQLLQCLFFWLRSFGQTLRIQMITIAITKYPRIIESSQIPFLFSFRIFSKSGHSEPVWTVSLFSKYQEICNLQNFKICLRSFSLKMLDFVIYLWFLCCYVRRCYCLAI